MGTVPRPAFQGGAPGPAPTNEGAGEDDAMEPCLRCGVPLPLRLYGCHGGRCPSCGHLYPHGDCSD